MNQSSYKERLQELNKLIKVCESKKSKFPQGFLRVDRNGNAIKYYIVTAPGDTHGKYIRKDNRELAKKLAEKDYCEQVLKEAYREREAINCFIKQMSGVSPEDVYANLNNYRKPLVSPVVLSDEEFAARWENEEYEGNPFHPEEKVYETKKGELVRSKSEAFIADMYYEMGIPYKYEYPVELSDGRKKYPDFTFLRERDRKVFYHEHMGCMEDEEYRHNNIIKIRDYSRSGIFLGDNLIVTFETDYSPFNIKDIRTIINKVING